MLYTVRVVTFISMHVLVSTLRYTMCVLCLKNYIQLDDTTFFFLYIADDIKFRISFIEIYRLFENTEHGCDKIYERYCQCYECTHHFCCPDLTWFMKVIVITWIIGNNICSVHWFWRLLSVMSQIHVCMIEPSLAGNSSLGAELQGTFCISAKGN